MVMVVVNEKGEGRMNEKGEVEKLRSVPVALVDWLAGHMHGAPAEWG